MGTAGLGIVICDSCGRVMGSLAKHIPIPTAAATVEALACRRALILAKELSIFVTMFKGDAELIIKALLAKEVHHLEYGHVIQDTLVLATKFWIYKFTHVKHVGNSVAHFLARRSKSGNEL